MNPILSVVIACYNEPVMLERTINSLRVTAGEHIEIVVVDDGSIPPLTAKIGLDGVKLIRNNRRRGVGKSRHAGVAAASCEFILITDAHMQFYPGWIKPALEALASNPKLLVCGQCIALSDRRNEDVKPRGVYNGARMVICDPSAELRWRILTAKWAKNRRGQDGYALSACMGAIYLMRRDFFLKLNGLELLEGFGGDEELLSLKVLLAGGEIRLLKNVRAGHRFRIHMPLHYPVRLPELLYNSMMIATTCCPKDVADALIGTLDPDNPDVKNAQRIMVGNRVNIVSERDYLQTVFTRSWDDYVFLLKSIDGA